jgi:hypothetical protein
MKFDSVSSLNGRENCSVLKAALVNTVMNLWVP